jgi:gamma-glutamyltranspeptidase/glutathione hydrolase
MWKTAEKTFAPFSDDPAFRPFFETFFSSGAPGIGDPARLPSHARTLRELAETNCESFYRGRIADAIDAFSKETGGLLRREDLAAYRPEWVTPLSVNYKGYDVCELPPNGHGIVALMALNILRHLDTSAGRDDELTVHRQLEAMKLAFTDGRTYISDPRYMKMKTDFLLGENYAAERAAEIGDSALMPSPIDPNCGGTVYMCAADGEGNMISHIQSNFRGFGSGIVIPGTGIALNDRGNGFRQKTLSHHHPRVPDERRQSSRPVRRHGRLHAAPGTRAGSHEHDRLRPEPAGGP